MRLGGKNIITATFTFNTNKYNKQPNEILDRSRNYTPCRAKRDNNCHILRYFF